MGCRPSGGRAYSYALTISFCGAVLRHVKCGGDLLGEGREDRRVVRGPLELARRLVDTGRGAARGERVGEEYLVDAQAGIAPERHHPVVPPGIDLLRLLEQPEAVLQS